MRRAGLEWELLLWALAGLAFLAGGSFSVREATGWTPAPRAASGFRVMTWNVGISLDSGSGPLRDEVIPDVAAVIARAEPDLCFLQEVDGPSQMRQLLRELAGEWSFLLADDHQGRHVAALVRSRRTRRMSGLDQRPECLGLRFTTPDGLRVAAVGVHADAFSSSLRNQTLGAAVNALRDERAAVRVLAGDFNLDMDLDKRRDLFTDDQYRDVETYNYVASAMRDAGRDGGSTAEPDRRLDYVFVEGEVTILAAGPWRGQRRAGMDHDPVLADLAPARNQ